MGIRISVRSADVEMFCKNRGRKNLGLEAVEGLALVASTERAWRVLCR